MSAMRKSVDSNTNPFEDDLELDNITLHDKSDSNTTYNDKNTPPSPSTTSSSAPARPRGPQPSFKLLFSMLSRHDFTLLLLPAILSSILTGGIAPFMTHVIGQIFDSFSKFNNTIAATTDSAIVSAAKHELIKSVGISAVELLGLAAGSLTLSTLNSALWIGTGERNVMRLRKAVFNAVSNREMEWFDTKMSADLEGAAVKDDKQIGAGGLMAKFTRETDDVRMASALAAGSLLQNLTTCIACLILAFTRSWALTLVILASVPLLIFVQGLSQRFAGPLLARSRQQSSRSATLVDRALSAIATVKASNAQQSEINAMKAMGDEDIAVSRKLYGVWALSSGVTQFMAMGMFVQAFWFGAGLVRSGKASTGAVMATFWACLQATTALQGCIPRLITVEKGKIAMVALINLVNPPELNTRTDELPYKTIDLGVRSSKFSFSSAPASASPKSTSFPAPTSPSVPASHHNRLRKIRPSSFHGELTIQDITFAYPSRPQDPVLRNVSLYIPAGETTFVVGSSGSGKSTIAALISRLYRPGRGNGAIFFDSQDASWLDEAWVREQVAVVSQTCILFEGSVHDNVAMGVAGGPASTTSPTLWGSGRDAPLRSPRDVSRSAVIDVCTAALIHDFVRDLPEGYDTQLGVGGASLSGGQKQRLAIARALLRDPTVLVLDEATSALDATTRVLVFEAIKARRRNKTTIVITHDLSQIDRTDFIYVLRNGELAEQGYRGDLETGYINQDGVQCGEFAKMTQAQGDMGGFPVVEDPEAKERLDDNGEPFTPPPDQIFEQLDEERREGDWELIVTPVESNEEIERMENESGRTSKLSKRISRGLSVSMQRGTLLNSSVPGSGLGWMLDVVNDLTHSRSNTPLPEQQTTPIRSRSRLSLAPSAWDTDAEKQSTPTPTTPSSKRSTSSGTVKPNNKKRSSMGTLPIVRPPPLVLNGTGSLRNSRLSDARKVGRFKSLQFVPMSPPPKTPNSASTTATIVNKYYSGVKQKNASDDDFSSDEEDLIEDDEEFEVQKQAIEQTGLAAGRNRSRPYNRRGELRLDIVSHNGGLLAPTSIEVTEEEIARPTLFSLFKILYRTLPSKVIVIIGLSVALASGAMTPLFSYLLSRLLFYVSVGATDVRMINILGAAVLLAAIADGILLGLKFFIMECAATTWIARVRTRAYHAVLNQPKSWHDLPQNAPVKLVQNIIKDGDDAKDLVGVVLGQFCVVVSMLSVGLIWALVSGWQLTLAGFAIAPIFAITMSVQSRLVAKCEARNKKAREEVAKGYYECISNIRAIRYMSFERVFADKFDSSVEAAYRIGLKGAFLEGCTFGVAASLIYLAEAVLFFVGALLVADGAMSYLKFVETVNLVVFTVTIGGQLMAFTQRIARSTRATRDINRLACLPDATPESKGILKPKVRGDLSLSGVTFSYPTRPNVPVLRSVSTVINAGECVAIVGASGCGKSTIAALLQRLYEPDDGLITVDGYRLNHMEVKHLRENIGVVSQQAHLFDASVSENIAYGMDGRLTQSDIEAAARAAHVHDFVLTLPRGYDTPLGENASLISGGQAQRLQIARALARDAKILILDECTSALDPANQAAVMETVRSAKEGRTTIIVTHKLAVMRMCERILVVEDGHIAEDGSFEHLMARNNVFAKLAKAGEWSGE